MIDWTMIGTITGVLVSVSALFLWVLRIILEPIKQLIQSNTDAVKQVVEKLDDHDVRLQCVETEVAILKDRGER
jgi:hypothetical protein